MTDTPATAVASPAQRVLDSIAAVVIAIAAIALVGLVLVQSWQVFTRYVLNDSYGMENMNHLGRTIAWLGKATAPHLASFPA